MDRRFGEDDDQLTEEERALQRLAAQRIREAKERKAAAASGKAAKFALRDEEEGGLTHLGRSLADIDDLSAVSACAFVFATATIAVPSPYACSPYAGRVVWGMSVGSVSRLAAGQLPAVAGGRCLPTAIISRNSRAIHRPRPPPFLAAPRGP